MRQIADDLRPVLHAFADDKRRGEARQKAWRIGFAVAGFVLGVPVFIASIVSLAHGGP